MPESTTVSDYIHLVDILGAALCVNRDADPRKARTVEHATCPDCIATANVAVVEPYCEHPGCHDTVTCYYAEGGWWTGATASAERRPNRSILMWFQRPEPWETGGIEVRRLCVIHARHRHGIAMGGRVHA